MAVATVRRRRRRVLGQIDVFFSTRCPHCLSLLGLKISPDPRVYSFGEETPLRRALMALERKGFRVVWHNVMDPVEEARMYGKVMKTRIALPVIVRPFGRTRYVEDPPVGLSYQDYVDILLGFKDVPPSGRGTVISR